MTRYDELDHKMASATVQNGAPIDRWLSCAPLPLFDFFRKKNDSTAHWRASSHTCSCHDKEDSIANELITANIKTYINLQKVQTFEHLR